MLLQTSTYVKSYDDGTKWQWVIKIIQSYWE